jgi:chaperonin GroEL (HSP60 family)
MRDPSPPRSRHREARRRAKELAQISKSTKDPKETVQVGAISANGDTTIGTVIAQAMEKVGRGKA